MPLIVHDTIRTDKRFRRVIDRMAKKGSVGLVIRMNIVYRGEVKIIEGNLQMILINHDKRDGQGDQHSKRHAEFLEYFEQYSNHVRRADDLHIPTLRFRRFPRCSRGTNRARRISPTLFSAHTVRRLHQVLGSRLIDSL